MKVIVWIGTENLKPGDVLNDINDYLNGLDNIIMDDGSKKGVREKMCEKPNYGHFVVTINKMMGDTSDEDLYRELMTPEPDYIDGAEERNEIRHKLIDCFNGVSVRGLPVLNIESGQEIDYSVLDERFKGSLAAMANTILEKAPYPRTVSVGGIALELNSTTAEVIISTVIEEANKGEIDLTGFEAFWKFITWKADNEIYQSDKSLEISLPLCQKYKAFSCSSCACSYRNDVIENTLEKIDEIFLLGSEEALEMFGEDVTNRVNEIYEATVNPWATENSCSTALKNSFPKKSEYCDFSEMTDDFIDPSNDIVVSCTNAFVCNSIAFDGTNVTISADNIYFSEDANIDVFPPPKSTNGIDGDQPGTNGGNGEDGIEGRSLYITANSLLKGSNMKFIVALKGGEGGDGGNGADGEKGKDGAAGSNGENGVDGAEGSKGYDITSISTANDPGDAAAVCTKNGAIIINTWDEYDTHCVCSCDIHNWWKQYEFIDHAMEKGGIGGNGGDGTDATNGQDGEDGGDGGTGGKGGNGGNGGPAGSVYVMGIDVSPIINREGGRGGLKGRGGAGGAPGIGGPGGAKGFGGLAGEGGQGGMGLRQNKRFYGKQHHAESCDCNWLHCGLDSRRDWYDEYSKSFDPAEECCQGDQGGRGQYGKDGIDGRGGHNGEGGNPGENGIDGVDA